ncbi:hypothetical protein BpHYR1_002772 [Brachionus plicatilis]|uniref:Uncharacterized protein n=1 Tax=Brachionus plicatilis TaxID=10195 RepID=A0A3M7T019_BRAPC|nr:hypothetical protein BpHYR1_002772 [Brachionus plicatilis]
MTENIDLKIFKEISEIGLVHPSYGCNINFTRDFECRGDPQVCPNGLRLRLNPIIAKKMFREYKR